MPEAQRRICAEPKLVTRRDPRGSDFPACPNDYSYLALSGFCFAAPVETKPWLFSCLIVSLWINQSNSRTEGRKPLD